MRILAVDYGEKRVGLAVSDALEITANPLAVLERKGDLGETLDAIARIVRDEQVEEIVVGLPVNADGSQGPAARAALAFADALRERVSVPVKTFDEFLTTVEAQERMIAAEVSRGRRRKGVDRVAAALILENYLGTRR